MMNKATRGCCSRDDWLLSQSILAISDKLSEDAVRSFGRVWPRSDSPARLVYLTNGPAQKQQMVTIKPRVAVVNPGVRLTPYVAEADPSSDVLQYILATTRR